MRVVMIMYWKGIKPEQYDALRQIVRWEEEPADGGLFHIAAFDDSGIHVTDLWESAEHFQRFTDTRLMPGVQQLGITSQPEVQICPVHALFAPAFVERPVLAHS